MAKIVKSRYKICFQTQNKVWIYKNSRLRYSYKIRNKALLLRGKIAKKFIVTNNMKWIVIRRKLVPYVRTKNRFKFHYKNLFFNKQQLKNFYGGLREYKFRNIFKKTWNVELFYRRNVFIGALEQRINIVLFRMRLLPTIFSSTQFILHNGIFVNENLITLPSYRVSLGHIVAIPEDNWIIFYRYLFDRLIQRTFGECLLIWRKDFTLKKIQYYRLKNKKFFFKNLLWVNNFRRIEKRFLILKKFVRKLINYYKKKSLEKKRKIYYNYLNFFLFFNNYIEILLRKLIIKMRKNLAKIRKAHSRFYRKNLHFMYYRLIFIKKTLKKFYEILYNFLKKILSSKKTSLIKSTRSEKLHRFFEDKKKLKKKAYKIYKKEVNIQHKWYGNYRRLLYLKPKNIKYNRRLYYIIRQLKYNKKKKKTFKNWCTQTHWYTPNYLEIDYLTLRSIFIYYPESNEVIFGFNTSFSKLISFYKERSL